MLPENHTEAAQRQIRDGDFQAWVEARCVRFYVQDHDDRMAVFEAHPVTNISRFKGQRARRQLNRCRKSAAQTMTRPRCVSKA